jgi:hypothetical protein
MSFRLSPPGLQTEVHGWVATYGNWKQLEISEYIGYIYIYWIYIGYIRSMLYASTT